MVTTPSNEMLKTAREKLYKIKNLRNFDNVNHLWFDLSQEPNFELVSRRIRDTKFKSNDVISLGFPRSGNHWVFEILNMVLNQTVDFTDDLMIPNAFETMTKSLKKQKLEGDTDIYTGHLTMDRLPIGFLEKGVKVVYILRNPKDAILSSFRLMTSYKNERVRLEMSWDEFFELQLTGEVPWGGWFDHVLKTEAFMKEHPTCQVFVMQFEKLKENPMKKIQDLCDFLGKPKDLAEKIAKVTSFSSMKEGTKKKMSVLEKIIWKEGWHFLDKGKVGGWKDKFTVAQNERFNEHFEKVCRNSELANRVREYIM